MCTPSLAIDVVIERGPDAVVLVRRRDNGLYATMGGFVDVGEDLHAAVARELAEETGLALVGAPRLLGVFGDARRDTRRHTVSVVYVAETSGEPRAGDDARAIRTVHVDDLANLDLAFDHRAIIDDYL
ncbi:mutator mutt protein, partial [Pelagophyceae sp. CCMP2097]